MAAKPNAAQREIAWENGTGIPYSCPVCPVGLQEEKMHSEEYQSPQNDRIIPLLLCLFACLFWTPASVPVNDGISGCLPLPKLKWLEICLDFFQQCFDCLKDPNLFGFFFPSNVLIA